jgi:hypothetical protein
MRKKEQPAKILCKVSYLAVKRAREKRAARPKNDRYLSGLDLVFAKKRLEKVLKSAAKRGPEALAKARARISL